MKTIEQVRDEIATMTGHTLDRDGRWHNPDGTLHGEPYKDSCYRERIRERHPVPTTLGGIAAMWPADRFHFMSSARVICPDLHAYWIARASDIHGDGGNGWTPYEGRGVDELEARTRLLHAVLSAQAARTEGVKHE